MRSGECCDDRRIGSRRGRRLSAVSTIRIHRRGRKASEKREHKININLNISREDPCALIFRSAHRTVSLRMRAVTNVTRHPTTTTPTTAERVGRTSSSTCIRLVVLNWIHTSSSNEPQAAQISYLSLSALSCELWAVCLSRWSVKDFSLATQPTPYALKGWCGVSTARHEKCAAVCAGMSAGIHVFNMFVTRMRWVTCDLPAVVRLAIVMPCPWWSSIRRIIPQKKKKIFTFQRKCYLCWRCWRVWESICAHSLTHGRRLPERFAITIAKRVSECLMPSRVRVRLASPFSLSFLYIPISPWKR